MTSASVLAAIAAAWAWLGAQGTWTQPAVVIFVSWLVPWVLRTYLPQQWETVTDAVTKALGHWLPDALVTKLRKAVQSVPSLCTAAAVCVLVEGGDLAGILRFELYALFAPIGHEIAKYYKGGSFPAAGSAKRPGGGASAVLLLLGLGLSVPFTTGCTASLEEARGTRMAARDLGVEQAPADRSYCRTLDTWRTILDTVAVTGAVGAGANGIPALMEEDWDPDTRRALGATAVSLGILSAGAATARARVDAAWARKCLQ